MATPEERLEEAADLAENASAIASDWANGPNRNVVPEPLSGPLPTIRKFLDGKSVEIDENANLIAAFEVALADPESEKSIAGTPAKDLIFQSNLSSLAINSITSYAPSSETDQPTKALLMNQAAQNTDRHIFLVGDSHGWAQGAPEWSSFSDAISNFSRYSPYVAGRGFFNCLADEVRQKKGWDTKTVHTGSTYFSGNFSGQMFSNSRDNDLRSVGFDYVAGRVVTAEVALAATRTKALDNFYDPNCFGDSTNRGLFRFNLFKGLFSSTVLQIEPATLLNFNHDDKKLWWTIPIRPNSTTPTGGDWVAITNQAGVVLMERNSTSGITRIYSTATTNRPWWMELNKVVFLPGYGLIKLAVIAAGVNGYYEVQDPAGTTPTAEILKHYYQGVRVYPEYLYSKAIISYKFENPCRVIYLAVNRASSRGQLKVYFTDNLSQGVDSDPYVSTVSPLRYQNAFVMVKDEIVSVRTINQSGSLSASTPTEVTFDASNAGITIDTANATSEEVIYRIELGERAKGRIFLEAVGGPVLIRGMVPDNNKIENWSCGANSIGALLGLESANAGGLAVDCVAAWLQYTPVRPQAVILQAPIVNEYIKQTPIATYKTRLQTFYDRFNNHLASSNMLSNVGTELMIFTSLRDKSKVVTDAGPITYADYIQATKEFCETNGHVFVDCDGKLLEQVDRGFVSLDRLYNDNTHPSDYANSVIYEAVRQYAMTAI